MFCTKCGKKNPEGARFCAFCGQPIEVEEQAPLEVGPAPDEAAEKNHIEADSPQESTDPDAPFKRPHAGGAAPRFISHVYGDAATVHPLADNPAQPRHSAAPTPSPESKPDAPRTPRRPDLSHLNIKREPVSPREMSGKAVTSEGKTLTPPSRKPPVRKPTVGAQPVAGPRRLSRRREDDLFFEDVALPDDRLYDDLEEEDVLAHRIKSAIALLFLAIVVIVAFWLFFTGSGAVFRASLGLGAPATAYKELGDQSRANGQLSRAADAYHNALKLDPENYQYALLVGQTKELVGENDEAIAAYQLCIQLRDTAVEPYRLLAECYLRRGDTQLAQDVRQAGYAKTGDSSLLNAD